MSLRRRILQVPKRLLRVIKPEGDSEIRMDTSPQEEVDDPQYTIDNWSPHYPNLWDWKFWSDALIFDFSTEGWLSKVEVLADGIYRVPIFKPGILHQFAEEIAELELWAQEHQVSLQPPNSMHDYGIEMRLIGIDKVFQLFTTEVADRIVLELFPEVREGGVNQHHAFTVTYGESHNRSLGFHADDSEVTFNFCLGGEFIGSDLYFQGRRCFTHMQTNHRPEEHIEIEQVPGTCIVHAGLHRHGVLPILQGNRRSLIVWTKSTGFRERDRRTECADWCGVDGDIL